MLVAQQFICPHCEGEGKILVSDCCERESTGEIFCDACENVCEVKFVFCPTCKGEGVIERDVEIESA